MSEAIAKPRRRAVRAIVAIVTGLLLHGPAIQSQDRVRGAVVNRDGSPQRGCRVEFYRSQQDPGPAFEAFTDDYGNFYLNNPPRAPFDVKVSSSGRSRWVRASIEGAAIHPTPLVVDW